jgi:hypothetical protein
MKAWSELSPVEQQQWRDKGKRCSEAVKTAIYLDEETALRSWLAIRLSDGGTDGMAYPSKETAVAFQLTETQCAYLRIRPGGISEREATSYLYHTAQLYENRAERERLIYGDAEVIREIRP